MPPIEVGASRAIGAVSADLTRKTGTDPTPAANAGKATLATPSTGALGVGRPTLATSEALVPGQPPIDAERVSQIRKAVESGSYPLVPARIADAMIAAGMFLRSTKA